MKFKETINILMTPIFGLTLALSLLLFGESANSNTKIEFVKFPEVYLKFPEKGKIIEVGITIGVKNNDHVKIFKKNTAEITQELINTAKILNYESIAVNENREQFNIALTKSIGAIVGNLPFSVFYTKIEISNMPTTHAKWKLLRNFGDERHYIDPGSIANHSNIVRIWLLSDLKLPETIHGKTYLSAVSFAEINCVESTKKTLLITAHSARQAKGSIIHESKVPFEWTPIISESVMTLAKNEVCH